MRRSRFSEAIASKESQAGFTLLELLVVITIIGILAAVAVPGLGKTIERTRVRDAQAILASVYSAEQVYRLDQGSYGTLADLVSNRYVTDPSTGNADWGFASSSVAASTFTVTATRTGGGYNGNTVTVDESFNGTQYGGTHPFRD